MPDPSERFATPRVAAGVVYRDLDARVLLVKPTYKAGWELPGGYAEVGESPKAAAIREVREELGVDWPVGELMVIDWAPHPEEGDKLLFIFDGGSRPSGDLPAQIPAPSELSSAAFHAVEQIPRLVPQRLSTRLLAAILPTRALYLENGQPVASQEPDPTGTGLI